MHDASLVSQPKTGNQQLATKGRFHYMSMMYKMHFWPPEGPPSFRGLNEPFAVSPYRGPYGGMHDGLPAGPKTGNRQLAAKGRFHYMSMMYKMQFCSPEGPPPFWGAPWEGRGSAMGWVWHPLACRLRPL
jgi:hypothetical protein